MLMLVSGSQVKWSSPIQCTTWYDKRQVDITYGTAGLVRSGSMKYSHGGTVICRDHRHSKEHTSAVRSDHYYQSHFKIKFMAYKTPWALYQLLLTFQTRPIQIREYQDWFQCVLFKAT